MKHPSHEGLQDIYKYPVEGPATHRHYKGGLYRFLYYGYSEASVATVVVYQSLQDGAVWTRPREDFEAVVDKKTKLLRFTPIGENNVEKEEPPTQEPKNSTDS